MGSESEAGPAGQPRLRLRPRRPRRLPFGFRKGLPKPPPNPSEGLSPKSSDGATAAGAQGRGPPPPPGPERRCGGRSSAGFTRSFRPSTSLSLNSSIARAASSSLPNSTNAKPRERPVSRSVPMWTLTTFPAGAKASVSSSRVVRKLRFPTNTFLGMANPPSPLWRAAKRAGSASHSWVCGCQQQLWRGLGRRVFSRTRGGWSMFRRATRTRWQA